MPSYTASAAREAAGLVLEAVQQGGTLPPFPPSCAPKTVAQGRRVAALVAEGIAVPIVGLRLAPAAGLGLEAAGPVLEPRLLRSPAVVPTLAGARRAVTVAVLAQLAKPLPARDRAYGPRDLVRRIASLHAAIDLAETRFTLGPPDLPAHLADLSGLGLILFGRPARAGWQDRVRHPLVVEATAGGERIWRGEVDLSAALGRGAEACRSAGGLPAGAVMVVAGLSPPLPDAPVEIRLRGLGAAARGGS
ncbi:MAG: hypothetical protein SNJ73_01185 [Acetobacteraceae bacterium]